MPFLNEAVQRVLDSSVVFSFDQNGYRRHARHFVPGDLEVDLRGRVHLITGSNSGIGYATALGLAKRQATVHLLCRDVARGQRAQRGISSAAGHGRVYFHHIDVSDFDSIRAFAKEWGEQPIDVLIHNAGVLPDKRSMTDDGLELTLATNLVGPFLLTRLLLPCLEQAVHPRILHVSSGGMYLKKLDAEMLFQSPGAFDGVDAYARTKRAQVVLTEMLAERLQSRGIVVHAMHPGWADTPALRAALPRFHRLTRRILRTAAQGADTMVWLAAANPALEDTGLFYFDRKPRDTHFLRGTKESESEREEFWKKMCDAIDVNSDNDWD